MTDDSTCRIKETHTRAEPSSCREGARWSQSYRMDGDGSFQNGDKTWLSIVSE